MNILDKFVYEMNAAAAIGSPGGIASYESPATITVKSYVETLRCGDFGDGADKLKCMLKGKISFFKMRLKQCGDDELCKTIVKKKIKRYKKKLHNIDSILNTNKDLSENEEVQQKTDAEIQEEKKEERKKLEIVKKKLDKQVEKLKSRITDLCIMPGVKNKLVCHIRLNAYGIEKLSRYSNECTKFKYYAGSCFRRIETLSKELKTKVDEDMSKLRS